MSGSAPHALYSKMLAKRTASRNVLVLFYLFIHLALDALAARCVDYCGLYLVASRGQLSIKIEYLSLAVLYLIREGLVVKKTVVCARRARFPRATLAQHVHAVRVQ